jgi:hypothetical protein
MLDKPPGDADIHQCNDVPSPPPPSPLGKVHPLYTRVRAARLLAQRDWATFALCESMCVLAALHRTDAGAFWQQQVCFVAINAALSFVSSGGDGHLRSASGAPIMDSKLHLRF